MAEPVRRSASCFLQFGLLLRSNTHKRLRFPFAGGKRWRPVLVLLIGEALGGKQEDLLKCAYLCELVHNGTLATDDIEDNSEMRRGKKCLHLIYGVDVAINAGNGAPLYSSHVLAFRTSLSAFCFPNLFLLSHPHR